MYFRMNISDAATSAIFKIKLYFVYIEPHSERAQRNQRPFSAQQILFGATFFLVNSLEHWKRKNIYIIKSSSKKRGTAMRK